MIIFGHLTGAQTLTTVSGGFSNYAFYNKTLNYDKSGSCESILTFKYVLNSAKQAL